ncbi:MAG TPA: acyl-CoA dehydrogenase family protein, partial [Thermoleophilaceae bacterium]
MTTSLSPTVADELTPDQLELQARARAFVEGVLMPLEQEAQKLDGRLPEDTIAHIRQEAVAARLQGGRFAPEIGGQGWSMVEWFLVNEQFGRVTNGLHWHVPNAYNVLLQGTPDQVDRYLRPILRGEGGETAYAVTEEDSGSDPSKIATTAKRSEGGWVIDGEKWFVTSGDVANVLIVMGNALVDGEKLPTLFLIEPDAPGVEFVDDPAYT